MEEKEKKRKIQPWWGLAERVGRSIVNQVVDKGLTSINDISKALKIDDVTVSKILIGRLNLKLSDIAKIENDLEITIIKSEEVDKEMTDSIISKLSNSESIPLTSEEEEYINKETVISKIFHQAKTLAFS